MANIANFELVGDDRTIVKVEVSLDGGATFGALYYNMSYIKSNNIDVEE